VGCPVATLPLAVLDETLGRLFLVQGLVLARISSTRRAGPSPAVTSRKPPARQETKRHELTRQARSGALCDSLNDQACTFWTSTTSEAFGTLAVRARLFFGTANDATLKTHPYGIWPVRSR
jgi:hypothetical protein